MKKFISRFNWFFKILFILYAIILFYTLFFGFDRPPLFNKAPITYNIIPFHTINYFLHLNKTKHWNFFIINMAGNILMFIPLSIFLSLYINKFLNFSISFLLIILCIELLQLITRTGTADIDDIILNYLGGVIGYLLSKSFKKLYF